MKFRHFIFYANDNFRNHESVMSFNAGQKCLMCLDISDQNCLHPLAVNATFDLNVFIILNRLFEQ